MSDYFAAALMQFKNGFAYRANVIGSLVGSVGQLIVMWFVWTAVFTSAGGTFGGFTLDMMITYMTISLILGVSNFVNIEYIVEEDVKTGKLAIMLTKPLKYPLWLFSLSMGSTVFALLMRIIPIGLVGLLFLNVSMPIQPVLFSISMVLGLIIVFLIMFLTSMWAFWSGGGVWGIRLSRTIIMQILSGMFVPLYFFPEAVRNVLYLLPFQGAFHTPLSIYIGLISGLDALMSIGIQIIWIMLLSALGWVVWKKASTKVFIQGG